jgi:hypothetical protein
MEVGFMGAYSYDDGAAFTFAEPVGYNTVLNNEMVFFLHGALLAEPGDFNHSGVVDAEDLAVWEAQFGADDGADADRDGDTDGADFLIWQRQADTSETLAASALIVPEPSIWLLISTTILSLLSLENPRLCQRFYRGN